MTPALEGGARIVVVDDEALVARVIVRRLRSQGLDASSVIGGAAAIDALAGDDPACDLVLLDMMMPEIGGMDVLRAVREVHDSARLPIIMLTARSESETIVAALEAGADDYVVKPPDIPVLLARIRSQLARVSTIAALARSEERYALAARGSADGLWDWDLIEGRFYVSPRWKQVLGHDPEEALEESPRTWLDRVQPDDAGRVDRAITDHVLGVEEHLEVEHRLRRRDGTFGWVLVRGAAVRDDKGRACRIAGSLTDTSRTPLHDSLTGLPNRHLLLERMDRAIRLARRRGDGGLAVLLVHIDRFGLVAETHGLNQADTLVVEIAARLSRCLREYDTLVSDIGGADSTRPGEGGLSRLGGSEFAVFCERIERPSDAARIADRMMKELAAPIALRDEEVYAGASIGISIGDGTASPEVLLAQARTALRRAIGGRGGGTSVALFDAELQEQAVARLRMESDLTSAIGTDGLFLEYQPIVDLATGEVEGFEALARWEHPHRGRIPPVSFIPLAEETGLIHPLGKWVLRAACQAAATWKDIAPGRRIAVNVSPEQLLRPRWTVAVEAVLAETGLDPSQLELELTEGVLARDPDTVATTLDRLRELGVKVSLDDFGTGYSSFGYLRRFAIDTVKIDRSFVSGLPGNDDGAAIARSIVAMATQLGMDVVAEGVETAEQATFLQQIGCGRAQGWHFGRPASGEAALRILQGASKAAVERG
jgi:diguanylate cyclase (GGDEF)-like protein/PAS domain S-box-containing protein